MDEAKEAIDSLERLGLTEYEAKCFVALTRLPHGTAREVAKVADIPRSRVYETMERLRNEGLVEVQAGEPRTFQSVSIDAAVRTLRKRYESYFDDVENGLRAMEPVYKETQQAVWAISNHEQVTERVIDLADDASEELLLILNDGALLGEDVVAAVARAADRGVTVYVGTTAADVRDRLRSVGADTEYFESGLVDWFDAATGTPRIGRVVMADRGPVLLSALHEERLPGVPNETAAWRDGIDHGFATFAERVFTYELAENVEDVSVDAVKHGESE